MVQTLLTALREHKFCSYMVRRIFSSKTPWEAVYALFYQELLFIPNPP